MANIISRLAGRAQTNSLQSIQRKELEAQAAQQKETLTALKALVEDHKEIKVLQDTVTSNAKQIEELRKQLAGLTK